jgi:hypothetical protein
MVQGTTALVAFRPLRADGFTDLEAGTNPLLARAAVALVVVPDPDDLVNVAISTRSALVKTTVRIQLDAGKRTAGRTLRLSAYNAHVVNVVPEQGMTANGSTLKLGAARTRRFAATLEHMSPAHPYCGDETHLTLQLDHDTFTVCLQDLDATGPVWHPDAGVFVTRADRDTSFRDYRALHAGGRTILQQVGRQPEQSFAGAFYGQPRGHAVNYSLGCACSPQRFWVEANGDLLLQRENLDFFGRRPELASRFLNQGSARFFFGFERWIASARFDGPSPAPVFTLQLRNAGIAAEETILCVPLLRGMLEGALSYHDPTVALVRLRFRNTTDAPSRAVLPVGYSQVSARSQNALGFDPGMDDYLVPRSPRDAVTLEGGRMSTDYQGAPVLRAMWDSAAMEPGVAADGGAVLVRTLQPGESCEVLLKVPFVAPAGSSELDALRRLEFDRSYREVLEYWRQDNRRGSQLETPIAHLDAVHASHLTHVRISDIAMPDDPRLINTSVGSSTYGNYANEACMIIQELDQRGLREEVERRLQVFVKYSGTVKQPGNFTDFEGSFYGAGGWECGDYNQHHGWALWYLAEHFLLTRDRGWFAGVLDAVLAGADWVFRQRRTTMVDLPHSRGWEHGFMPAGSLEDVTEFCYWLSTNCFSWRGTDAAARALEAFGHPEAGRVRRESDAFRADLRRGFETARQHAPLVPLRDGRWVPQIPSRLYRRGRDYGWIRALLEGSVNLLISGLYEPDSKEAGWILEDLQDNLYHSPPYGYVLRDAAKNLRHRGGFSIQPTLLAGLLPHLDRDEIEVYLWMFFNAWAACYREEVGGMIEHPMPELGYDNATVFKTSDEANAVMWLRYLMVYSTPRFLHLGRAIPRAWFAHGEQVRISGVRTHYGEVSAHWISNLAGGTIALEAVLEGPQDAPRLLARFRHPGKAPIRSVTVNGQPWSRFDPVKGDVDITGLRGEVRIVAGYQRMG